MTAGCAQQHVDQRLSDLPDKKDEHALRAATRKLIRAVALEGKPGSFLAEPRIAAAEPVERRRRSERVPARGDQDPPRAPRKAATSQPPPASRRASRPRRSDQKHEIVEPSPTADEGSPGHCETIPGTRSFNPNTFTTPGDRDDRFSASVQPLDPGSRRMDCDGWCAHEDNHEVRATSFFAPRLSAGADLGLGGFPHLESREPLIAASEEIGVRQLQSGLLWIDPRADDHGPFGPVLAGADGLPARPTRRPPTPPERRTAELLHVTAGSSRRRERTLTELGALALPYGSSRFGRARARAGSARRQSGHDGVTRRCPRDGMSVGRLLGPGEPEARLRRVARRARPLRRAGTRGHDADAAVPGLRTHLAGCPACRDEHESLPALVGGDQAR